MLHRKIAPKIPNVVKFMRIYCIILCVYVSTLYILIL